ncbi:hypothetical protein [Alicyclobacillus dauci]|uniref:Uncharacterized protein n=1 Tax=Alicyclobacillus dauci TaxID=1475485 RepID=A0ABY6YYT7_9BACL|nr:hypothetical protein [Alicyclobacillus dauci]WAH35286.1 hypothetical protein NZD86_13305 [Alicyclobacillus dauci]
MRMFNIQPSIWGGFLIWGETLAVALVGSSSWNDSDGMDGSTGYDSTTQSDGTQDASVFLR